jgi:hypothetical protein
MFVGRVPGPVRLGRSFLLMLALTQFRFATEFSCFNNPCSAWSRRGV